MVTKRNPYFLKADWFRFCSHLRSLNLYHFKVVKAMGLKAVEVTFNGMNSLLNCMKVYQLVQKLLVEDTHTDRLVISQAFHSFLKGSGLENKSVESTQLVNPLGAACGQSRVPGTTG
jgi:hypothetical protein